MADDSRGWEPATHDGREFVSKWYSAPLTPPPIQYSVGSMGTKSDRDFRWVVWRQKLIQQDEAVPVEYGQHLRVRVYGDRPEDVTSWVATIVSMHRFKFMANRECKKLNAILEKL